jgi:hypothetical protein
MSGMSRLSDTRMCRVEANFLVQGLIQQERGRKGMHTLYRLFHRRSYGHKGHLSFLAKASIKSEYSHWAITLKHI